MSTRSSPPARARGGIPTNKTTIRTAKNTRSSLGVANQSQPLRQLPPHQLGQEDRNESIDGSRRSTAHRETSTRAAKTTVTPRRSSPSAAAAPAAHRGRAANYRQPGLSKTQGGRPATTGAGEHRGHGGYSDGDGDDGYDYDGTESLSGSRARGTGGAARLIATAPAPSVVAAEAATEAEEPRYLAARVAGEMSARAYPRRTEHDGSKDNRKPSGEHPPSLFVDNGRAATARPGWSKSKGAERRAGQRQRQRQRHWRRRQQGGGGGGGGGGRGGRGDSSSDVSVSSCGDMTISSEEQEGEEMAYTG